MTCSRTQEFLAQAKIGVAVSVDARKNALGRKEALELLKKADALFACKGAKVVHHELKAQRPADKVLLDLVIGPTGNLRAPALFFGKTLVVGFELETYRRLLT